MTTLKGLPAFFQNNGTTVLEELTNFDLGANEEDNFGDEPFEISEDTFGDDAFGDLKTDNLPSFFTAPKSNELDSFNILDFGGLNVSNNDSRPVADSLYTNPNNVPVHHNVYLNQPLNNSNIAPGLTPNKNLPGPPPGMTKPVPPAVPVVTPAAVPRPGGFPVPRPYSSAVSGSATVVNSNAINSANFAQPQRTQQNNQPVKQGQAPNFQQQQHLSEAHSQQQQGTGPPGGFVPRREYRRAKNMHQSDIRFIVGKVIQPLQSNDPFADDFYFLQLSIKKNNKMRETALREAAAPPPLIYVPLPTWKETKERIKLQIDVTRKGFQQKSREWEEKEQVLGHQVRTDITKPREMLHVPTLSEMDADMMDDDDSEYKCPFTSRLWTIRAAVQRGFEALYTVQELHHLMSSPVIASNPLATDEILREIDSAVSLLSHSIGIRTITLTTPHKGVGAADFSLDGGHVGAILQTPKGKKLMSRSLKLLSPEHRWALLPVILARMFLSTTAPAAAPGTDQSGVENQVIEHKLLRTIIEFLQFSFQHQIQQQKACPQGVPAEFTNTLLTNLRACMKSVLVTQMEKSKLRQALVTDRVRAEVMHMIVQIGDKVSTVSGDRLREDWVQTREAFMSTLDS